jgi:hypothetical protein
VRGKGAETRADEDVPSRSAVFCVLCLGLAEVTSGGSLGADTEHPFSSILDTQSYQSFQAACAPVVADGEHLHEVHLGRAQEGKGLACCKQRASGMQAACKRRASSVQAACKQRASGVQAAAVVLIDECPLDARLETCVGLSSFLSAAVGGTTRMCMPVPLLHTSRE